MLPVAADGNELLDSGMTTTLNDWDWVCPDNTRVTTSEPLDSDTDKVEELNSTVVTIATVKQINHCSSLKELHVLTKLGNYLFMSYILVQFSCQRCWVPIHA